MRLKSLLATLPALAGRCTVRSGPARGMAGAATPGRPGDGETGSWPGKEMQDSDAGALVLPSGAWLDRCSGGYRLSRGR